MKINHRSLTLAPILLAACCALLPALSAAADAALQQAIANPQRTPANVERDVYRHPRETLEFMGIRPDLTVIEILPGEGWYTEILAPYLRGQGRLIAAGYGAKHPQEYMRNSHARFQEQLKSRSDLFGKVELVSMWPAPFLAEVADASVDMVLDFRNIHNHIRSGDVTEEVFRAYHRILKPGGVLGIVEHRANPGSDAATTAPTGYVPVAYVIEIAERMGFKLEGQSEINANPKDTKDHPGGVWTLPPRLRTGDADPAKYKAIGESDRMTLKFVK